MRRKLAAVSIALATLFTPVVVAPVAHANPNAGEPGDHDGCNAICEIGKLLGKLAVLLARLT